MNKLIVMLGVVAVAGSVFAGPRGCGWGCGPCRPCPPPPPCHPGSWQPYGCGYGYNSSAGASFAGGLVGSLVGTLISNCRQQTTVVYQ